MSLKVWLYLIYLSVSTIISHSTVLRIRLQSGTIHRLDVNEKTSTSQFLQLLRDKGYSSADASYIINKSTFSHQNITQGEFLSTFNLHQGDVIDIHSSSSPTSSSTTRKASTKASIDKIAETTKPSTKKTKPKVMTMTDLRNYRSSLIKMKNEKSKNDRVAAVSLSSGRILKRLTQGGIGVMLGRISQNQKAKSSRRKTRPSSSSAPTATKDDPATSSLYEVHAICELEMCTDSNSLPWNLQEGPTHDNLQKIRRLGEQLGLQIIGCCVGIPTTAYTMWSAYHVHLLLQLQHFLQQQNLMMIRYVPLDESTWCICLINDLHDYSSSVVSPISYLRKMINQPLQKGKQSVDRYKIKI
jgi:hypothetical protein